MSRITNPTPGTMSAVLLTLLFSSACFAAFKEGDNLPDLASFRLEGRLPEALKGQVILIDFWASWCPPCISSFPAMEELTKKYTGRGLTILAVSVDEKQENMQRFLKSAKVSFAVVRDAQQKLVAAADVPAMPTSFLIDRSGKIRFVHAGFDRDQTTRQYVKEIEQLLLEPSHDDCTNSSHKQSNDPPRMDLRSADHVLSPGQRLRNGQAVAARNPVRPHHAARPQSHGRCPLDHTYFSREAASGGSTVGGGGCGCN